MIPYWRLAKKQTHNKAQQQRNFTMDTNFPFLVEKVKKLLTTYQPLVFERNFKREPSGSLASIHAFVAPTVYLNLDCNCAYDYEMKYAFGNCPQEAEIRALMRSYRLDDKAKEIALQPDFNTFYKDVQAFQGLDKFYKLKPN